MRALAAVLIWLAALAAAHADGTAKPDYTAIVFHDVVDDRNDLPVDAITTIELIRFFDWLKGSGWTVISIDDIERAESGARLLPEKSILLTFDDGYESVYSKVYPLLLAYRYPAVVAVTGSWMAIPVGGMVSYGSEQVPRSAFLTWDQVREMATSGLVEVASHSYGLHTGILANPQDNLVPAAATWRYDAATNSYELDASYRKRIREDLAAARRQIEQELGTPPRTLVWPFGRRTGPAAAEAEALGFTHQLTLYESPNTLTQASAINRFYPSQNPRLDDLASMLRFDAPMAETKRVVCFALDELGAAPNADEAEHRLGGMIDTAHAAGANIVVLDVAGVPPVAPAGIDILSHAVWQIRGRVGAEVYLRVPAQAIAEPARLYGDVFRRARADGLVLDASPALLAAGSGDPAEPSSAQAEVQKRRAALDASRLAPADRATMQLFAAASTIEPDLKLMLVPTAPVSMTGWPAPIADLLLLPPVAPATLNETLLALERANWLTPTQAPRVVITLPAGSPIAVAHAARAAQTHGATALAICPAPGSPRLTPKDASIVSSAFSSRTLPLGQ
jgi:biofilm PGA synthesis lipoprotein PgaB